MSEVSREPTASTVLWSPVYESPTRGTARITGHAGSGALPADLFPVSRPARPALHKAEEWPAVLDRMRTNMEAMGKGVITDRERDEITGYLAKVAGC